MYNILNEVDQTGNKNDSRGFNVNINLKYDILEGLRYETVLGLAYNNTVGESYATELSHYITAKRQYEFGTARPEDDLYKASPLPHGGELNRTENRNWNYTWRNSISYSRVFDLHRAQFYGGTGKSEHEIRRGFCYYFRLSSRTGKDECYAPVNLCR